MDKGKVSNKHLNDQRRKKGYTLNEWRRIFLPTLRSVADRIYRELDGRLPKTRQDIKQHLEASFMWFYRIFTEGWYYTDGGKRIDCGMDKYPFPPPQSLFYAHNYYDCMHMFLLAVPSKKEDHAQVGIWEHCKVNEMVDESELEDFYEARERRLAAAKEVNLITYLSQRGIEVSLDPNESILWGLWWIGHTYTEVAAIYSTLLGSRYSPRMIQLRMDKLLNQIQEETGLSRNEIRELRRYKDKIPVEYSI